MSSEKNERVFVVGATGNIGIDVVRGLVRGGVDTTAYVRDEAKARGLFADEILSGHLKIVVGTYSTVDVFVKAIEGHTRLFLLAAVDPKRPTLMAETKGTFAKIAYEKGLRQIVDLSSFSVRARGRQGVIGYSHTTSEEKLWALADENPEQRSLVILRPGSFMTNHFLADVLHIKRFAKLMSTGSSSSTTTWIDTKDISACAVAILSEPVAKHDRCIYEMGGQTLTQEQRAAIFTTILGKPITYEEQSIDSLYKTYIGFGMAHAFAYDLISYSLERNCGEETPQLSILLNRPVRTLQEWLQENIKAFE